MFFLRYFPIWSVNQLVRKDNLDSSMANVLIDTITIQFFITVIDIYIATIREQATL